MGKIISVLCFVMLATASAESRLPFSTVFKGRDKFDSLVAKAKAENWKALPIGERTAADWLADNDRRGLVEDLTRSLGGTSVAHSAREMTVGWRHYRYLAHNKSLLGPLGEMEARVSNRPLYQISKSHVASIEPRLRSGDIIGIISRDRGGLYSTSHVGLAVRVADGSLHFMHASSPRNYGKVVIDSTLSSYLARYRTDSGILVARPLK